MTTQNSLRLDTTARYEIRIQGYLDRSWFERMASADFQVEHSPDGASVTVFTGEFVDQAALTGALNLLYDLGFPLLSVQCLEKSDFTKKE